MDNKIDEYNSNAENKTDDFNSNFDEKMNAIDEASASIEKERKISDRKYAKALPENSYVASEDKFTKIFNRLDELEKRVSKVENADTKEPIIEEYPAYVQPTGAHDSYKVGDKVIYNRKKYICKLDNCVWAPDIYPDAWKETVEEVVEDNIEVSEEDLENNEIEENE